MTAGPLTIGQLAKATGVPARTILYYERVGVLPAPGRTPAGYRQYTDRGMHRLRFVRRARALGLSLADVKLLTATLENGARGAVRPRLQALVRVQLSAVRRQSADLRLLERDLRRTLRRLDARRHRDRSGACRCLEERDTPTPGPS